MEYYVLRLVNSLFWRFLLKIYCDKEYIWAGIGPHRRAPCAYTRGDKYMRVSFFLIPYRELKEASDDEIEWPELSVVSMSGELHVNSIFLCL